MMFQTLDNKNECIGLYIDGKLIYPDLLSDDLTKTWDYSEYLRDQDVEYASLYCAGKTLTDVCPESFFEEFLYILNLLSQYQLDTKKYNA